MARYVQQQSPLLHILSVLIEVLLSLFRPTKEEQRRQLQHEEPEQRPLDISTWRRDRNKDDMSYYLNSTFRQQYAQYEMRSKAKQIRSLTQRSVADLLLLHDGRPRSSYQILSLGCGPGSDLVGVCNAFQRASSAFGGVLNCLGVDFCDWRWKSTNRDRRSLLQAGVFDVRERFRVCSMEEFVASNRQKFHVVVLSYANVKDNVELVGDCLPRLLTRGGRIFVLDNASRQLQRLAQDFQFTEGQAHCDSSVFFEYQRP